MSAPGTAPLGQRTALYPFHVAHAAHLVPFGGWEMPLYYDGILAEHRAVRASAGFFDVGHMGILTVAGATSAALLSRRTTANVARLAPGQCRYTFLLDLAGAIVDDLLITRVDDGAGPTPSFLVVPNAATAGYVFDLLRQHRHPDTEIARHNGAVTIVAVQGPESRKHLEAMLGWSLEALPFYHGAWFPAPGGSGEPAGRLGPSFPSDLGPAWFVSRTGYTGELGYELFVPGPAAGPLADRLVAAGLAPCGLGARDTLRLEKGYLLSGQDFHRDRTPLEAGQDRFVEFDHPFVGRPILDQQRADGVKVRCVGLSVAEPNALPRPGTPVASEGRPIGIVSSGGLSPTLGHGIALAYLPRELGSPGTAVELDLRGRRVPATVVKLPFVRAPRAG